MNEVLSTIHRGPFAGRERNFQLRLGEIEQLEVACKAGIGEIALRLTTGMYRLADVRETIRLGLVGGGESEPSSTALVMGSFDLQPILPFVPLAALIISACLAGVESPKEVAEAPDGQATSATS